MFFGECIDIDDSGIACKGCVWGWCDMGDRSGMCGGVHVCGFIQVSVCWGECWV